MEICKNCKKEEIENEIGMFFSCGMITFEGKHLMA